MFTPMPGQSWEEAFADFSKAEALREQAWKRIGYAVGAPLGVARPAPLSTKQRGAVTAASSGRWASDEEIHPAGWIAGALRVPADGCSH